MSRAFEFLYGRPRSSVQCPGCHRWFTTRQGLGLHFAWLKRPGVGHKTRNLLHAKEPRP